MADPLAILNASRNAALGYANATSNGAVAALLKRAQADLNARIKAMGGKGEDSFTLTQMQGTLKQIKAIADLTKQGLLGQVLTGTSVVAEKSAAASIKYMQVADKKFRGVSEVLGIRTAAVMDQAVSGAQASVLRRVMSDPNHPGRPGVMERYGDAVVGHFENTLQTALVTGAPWDDVKAQLTEQSPFLKQAPAHWAERIVRTEFMGAHNVAGYQATSEINNQTGGNLIRILCATFDDRTGADSVAVHGQIRRMDEPFESWFGSYMTPPNRPNDREIVVPHHLEWEIPANLKPKSDSDVLEHWHREGRKGSPPARPLMSTVPAELIGKPVTAKSPTPIPQPPTQPPTDTESPVPAPTNVQPPPVRETTPSAVTWDVSSSLSPVETQQVLGVFDKYGIADLANKYPVKRLSIKDLEGDVHGMRSLDAKGGVHLTIRANGEPKGRPFTPGRLNNLRLTAKTPVEFAQTTLLHEFGHQLHHSNPEVETLAQEAYTKAKAEKKIVTTYGGASWPEWYAETFAAYHQYPEKLKAFSPSAYETIEKSIQILRGKKPPIVDESPLTHADIANFERTE